MIPNVINDLMLKQQLLGRHGIRHGTAGPPICIFHAAPGRPNVLAPHLDDDGDRYDGNNRGKSLCHGLPHIDSCVQVEASLESRNDSRVIPLSQAQSDSFHIKTIESIQIGRAHV